MPRRPIQLLKFIREVIAEFNHDRGTLFAAAISYYGLISLIPMLLVVIAGFGYVMGSYAVARQHVVMFIDAAIPVGSVELEHNLNLLSRQSGLLGWLGLAGLLWVGTQVFVTLQDVMNIAMGAERVSFLRARGTALVTLLAAGLLLTLSIGITSLLTAARSLKLPVDVQQMDAFWTALGILLPILLSVLAFSTAYRFLPNIRIGNKAPIIGGMVAGLLFEFAKHTFSWYVRHVANYSVYGSLGGVVVLVVWIYYVSVITVLGAEVASLHSKWALARKKSTGDSPAA